MRPTDPSVYLRAMSRNTSRALIAALLLLATGACSAGPTEPASQAPPTAAPSLPASSAEQSCGVTAPAGVTVGDLQIPAEDDVTLNAAAVGTGPTGVVLLHQTNDGLCGWLPYATQLAARGFNVLAFDQRCTFGSSCVEGEQQYNLIGDVEAAVATLRERGAREVTLVGASLGGSVAIGACTRVEVTRCAALSPAVFDRKLGGVTANTAIGQVRRPLLVAIAPDDPDSALDEGRALVRRARKGVVTFVPLPAGSGHGWETVRTPTDPAAPSAFAGRLEEFLRAG